MKEEREIINTRQHTGRGDTSNNINIDYEINGITEDPWKLAEGLKLILNCFEFNSSKSGIRGQRYRRSC